VFDTQSLYQEVGILCLSGCKHLTLWLINKRFVPHTVLCTDILSEGTFHAVLFTQLPYQQVSISHAVLSTQSFYQEVCILCCVSYTVTTPGSMSCYVVCVVHWR